MNWQYSPHKLLMFIGVGLGLALALTISGCEQNPSSQLSRVIQAFGDLKPLPKQTEKEYLRFAKVFRDITGSSDGADEKLRYFRFGFKRIRAAYVKPVNETRLIDAAIKGLNQKNSKQEMSPEGLIESALEAMTKSLDPHSDFLNARDFRESFIHTKGEFGGLGIEVTMQDGLVKVISPIEDTPAERAGLMPGDLIVAVDGEPIKGLSLAAAVGRMRGGAGEPISLQIRRNGRSDFVLTLVRAVITVKAVRWRVIEQVAYIRVSRFSEKMERGVVKAFSDIREKLGRQPLGVILDLRNNPGGLLEQSVVLADAFLNSGQIVSVRGRSKNQQSSFEASNGDLAAGVPMVVLVNSGSASASEIVVSALKYQKRATVFGSRTFGKGTVQTVIPMPEYGALRLTTALYYGADGHTIQGRGVLPDILIESKQNTEGKGRRESDLPGAIPSEKAANGAKPAAEVSLEHCPIAYVPERAGRKKIEDKLLGCALGFLKAGSQEKFLARMNMQNKN